MSQKNLLRVTNRQTFYDVMIEQNSDRTKHPQRISEFSYKEARTSEHCKIKKQRRYEHLAGVHFIGVNVARVLYFRQQPIFLFAVLFKAYDLSVRRSAVHPPYHLLIPRCYP